MPRFLIDVNLPYYLSIWNNPDYIHQKNINDEWDDNQIWNYAMQNNLVIITKDIDFSNKILLNSPPPKVIHIKFGNMKMKEFFNTTYKLWPAVLEVSETYKLVTVFKDRIEGIN